MIYLSYVSKKWVSQAKQVNIHPNSIFILSKFWCHALSVFRFVVSVQNFLNLQKRLRKIPFQTYFTIESIFLSY